MKIQGKITRSVVVIVLGFTLAITSIIIINIYSSLIKSIELRVSITNAKMVQLNYQVATSLYSSGFSAKDTLRDLKRYCDDFEIELNNLANIPGKNLLQNETRSKLKESLTLWNEVKDYFNKAYSATDVEMELPLEVEKEALIKIHSLIYEMNGYSQNLIAFLKTLENTIKDESATSRNVFMITAIVISIFSLLIALFLSLLFSNRIDGQIKLLNEFVQKISDGDFTSDRKSVV
jgi:nitrogen fixation/metabolism regulation signal transduction histidine kinase